MAGDLYFSGFLSPGNQAFGCHMKVYLLKSCQGGAGAVEKKRQQEGANHIQTIVQSSSSCNRALT